MKPEGSLTGAWWLLGLDGVLWLTFLVRVIMRWNHSSSSVHWIAIALLTSYPMLWYSVLCDEKPSFRLFSATLTFVAAMFALNLLT